MRSAKYVSVRPIRMPAMIGAPEILEHLRAVVAEHDGRLVTSGFSYGSSSGEPLSIVGHVYARLGLLSPRIARHGAYARVLLVDKITEAGRDVLYAAQSSHDSEGEPVAIHATLSEALAAAEACYAGV